MSLKKVGTCGKSLCSRHEQLLRLSNSVTTEQRLASRSGRRSLSCSTRRHKLRIEGVQGPFSTQRPANLQDTNDILRSASKRACEVDSHQGVQDTLYHSRISPVSQVPVNERLELKVTACPQGVQGSQDTEAHCTHFSTWLKNCSRYGFASSHEQLQGVQTGQQQVSSLSQALAEQELMTTLIAEGYQQRIEDLPDVENDESLQGAQGELSLPTPSAPCPQGVQGDDCVRFKLWLANCHRFGLESCLEDMEGFRGGRLTLAQLFKQQDQVIRQVALSYQQRRHYSTTPGGEGRANNSSQVGAEPPLGQKEKLKRAVKEYGSTVIVFHVAISLASLGGFYLAVSSGIDMVGILKSVGVGEAVLQSKLATGTGTFVMAYAVHKVFAPVRIGITLTSTPLIVRYLRAKGVLKPPKPSS